MVQKIVGLCGRKGSGKSTLAHLLQPCSVISFAGPLKDALVAMGIPRRYLTDTDLKEEPLDLLQGKTPRYAMQTLGTEWGRNTLGQNFWVDLWRKRVQSADGLVVCDDVRFDSEVELLRDMGATVVYIERPGLPAVEGEHESESLLPIGMTILRNDGTPQELLEKFNAVSNRES